MDNSLTFLNACRNGQKSIVQIFLKKGGIDVNKRDAEGNTPLHHACLNGHRDIVSLLLENKADPAAVNNKSETPLHAAAKNGNKEILERLLDCGSDINAADKEGKTPLICLADNRRTDAAIRLIERGADTSLTDNDGHTALDYATAHGLKSLVENWLNPKNPRQNPPKTQQATPCSTRRCTTTKEKSYGHYWPPRPGCWMQATTGERPRSP